MLSNSTHVEAETCEVKGIHTDIVNDVQTKIPSATSLNELADLIGSRR